MNPSRDRLAIDGGPPVRTDLLPYSRQALGDEEVAAVAEVLRSDWITTGPKVEEFEEAFAAAAGTTEAVAVSSGTAALHAAAFAVGIGPGDEVIVPALTFAATANAVVHQGGTAVFADVGRETLLLEPAAVEARLTPHTRAIIAVDYAGQPCDYDALRALCARRGIALLADACHALGGSYRGRPVGSLARLSTFSFHPVKHVATGEGGMVTTDDGGLARRMRVFRNHGITTDYRQRADHNSCSYEMVELGLNYRLSDIHCALGLSQLNRLGEWVRRRRQIAARYDDALTGLHGVEPLAVRPDVEHAYHLYVVRLVDDHLACRRDEVFAALRAEGIGVVVHYPPVHLHPFYRRRFGTEPGLCPVAEEAAGKILSLPLFPTMKDRDVDDVISALGKVMDAFSR